MKSSLSCVKKFPMGSEFFLFLFPSCAAVHASIPQKAWPSPFPNWKDTMYPQWVPRTPWAAR